MIQDTQSIPVKLESVPSRYLKLEDFIQNVWGQVAMMHLMYADVNNFLCMHSSSSVARANLQSAVKYMRHGQLNLREVLKDTTSGGIDADNRGRLKSVDKEALQLNHYTSRLINEAKFGWISSEIQHISYMLAIWLRSLSQRDGLPSRREDTEFSDIRNIAKHANENTLQILRSYSDYKHRYKHRSVNQSQIICEGCTMSDFHQATDYIVARHNFLLNSNLSEIVSSWVKMIENVSSVEKLLDPDLVNSLQSDLPGTEILFSPLRFANLAKVFIEGSDITDEWNINPSHM
jgi:hypothetical protein